MIDFSSILKTGSKFPKNPSLTLIDIERSFNHQSSVQLQNTIQGGGDGNNPLKLMIVTDNSAIMFKLFDFGVQ